MWLRRAEKSLESLADYIAEDNKKAAYKLVMKIRKSAHSLIENPKKGRTGRVYGTRELIIPGTNYILPYRVKNNTIQILHVLHGAQNWPGDFRK